MQNIGATGSQRNFTHNVSDFFGEMYLLKCVQRLEDQSFKTTLGYPHFHFTTYITEDGTSFDFPVDKVAASNYGLNEGGSMKTKPYVVRAYLLSQHVMPHVRIPMESKELAISLAEVLLEENHIHYVTVINHYSDEDVLAFKKELVLKE